jgi:hypothetical protein
LHPERSTQKSPARGKLYACTIVLFLVVPIFHITADTNVWLTAVPVQDVRDTLIYQTNGYANKKQYTTSVYGRDLEKVIKWKEGSEFPLSLSAVKAHAQAAFSKAFPQLNDFKVASINLIRIQIIDDWIIQVEFRNSGLSDSDEKSVNLIVLLDGNVLVPTEQIEK